MQIPQRIKSLYPNGQVEEETPIPIEYAFFLEDGTPDPNIMNRFHFKFPGNWCTSNNGETIIGVRNISVVPRRRKIEFDLSVRKYLRKVFEDLKRLLSKYK